MFRSESILDEKYLEIQNTTNEHLTTLQDVITVLKSERKDVRTSGFDACEDVRICTQVFFMPNSLDGRDRLGELSFACSTMPPENPLGLPVTTEDVDNRPEAMASGMRQIGKWGNGSLEFWCPSGLTMTRNNEFLIVVDSWNHRLQVRHFDRPH